MTVDYRKDIIKLMQSTDNTDNSLNQSMIALELVTKIYKDAYLCKEKMTNENTKNDVVTEQINNFKTTTDTESVVKKGSKEITNNNSNKNKNVTDSKDTANKVSPVVLKNRQKHNIYKKLPKPIVKKVKNLSKKPNKYIIRRKLLGSEAIDENGTSIQYFNEYMTRSLKLEDGAIVFLSNSVSADGSRNLIKVDSSTELKENISGDKIIEFGPAVVQRDLMGLYIQKNIKGEQLSKVNSEKARFYFDLTTISNFKINDGDLVLVAWHQKSPSFIKVRWKYDLTDEKINSKDKKKTKSKKVKALIHRHDRQKSFNIKINHYIPRLNFDLNKKKVTIVVGDKSITSNLTQVVESHNGIVKICEMRQPGNALRAAKESDYVILIQSYIKHSISQLLINTKNRNYSIAMATNAGQLDVEKALYRAKRHLNVVDSDGIDYPII